MFQNIACDGDIDIKEHRYQNIFSQLPQYVTTWSKSDYIISFRKKSRCSHFDIGMYIALNW